MFGRRRIRVYAIKNIEILKEFFGVETHGLEGFTYPAC